jgi:hypothetical protein
VSAQPTNPTFEATFVQVMTQRTHKRTHGPVSWLENVQKIHCKLIGIENYKIQSLAATAMNVNA